MKTAIRKTGNSQGGLIPKPLLAQVGLEVEAEMFVEKGAIVIRKPRRAKRRINMAGVRQRGRSRFQMVKVNRGDIWHAALDLV